MAFGRNSIHEAKHYLHIRRRCRRLNIINNEFLTQTRFALQSVFFCLQLGKISIIHGTQRTLQATQHMR